MRGRDVLDRHSMLRESGAALFNTIRLGACGHGTNITFSSQITPGPVAATVVGDVA